MTSHERADFYSLFAQVFPELPARVTTSLDTLARQLHAPELPESPGAIAYQFTAGPLPVDAILAAVPTARPSPFALVPAHPGSGWTLYLVTDKFTFPTGLNALGCLAVAYLRAKNLTVDRFVSLRVNTDYIRDKTLDPFTFFTPYNPNTGKFHLQVDAFCAETHRLFNPTGPQPHTVLTDKNFLECLADLRTAIAGAGSADPFHAAFTWLKKEHFRPALEPTPKTPVSLRPTPNPFTLTAPAELAEFWSQLVYPVRFLDFETTQTLIPPEPGMGPRKQYPFMYSIHQVESPGAAASHTDYIRTRENETLPVLGARLRSDLGEHGTIFVYTDFERTCLDNLIAVWRQAAASAEEQAELAAWLDAIKTRIIDLAVPFGKKWLTLNGGVPAGKYSIKLVSAVLMERPYAELGIVDGLKAQDRYRDGFLPPAEGVTERTLDPVVEQELRAYCKTDTEVMIAVYQAVCSYV